MSAISETPLVFRCRDEDLVGIVHRNAGADRRVGVVIVVGGPQYRVGSHRQFVLLARALAAAGYPVLRFDYGGMGDSDGPLRTFESAGAGIRAAVDTLMDAVPALDGVVLWGLCDAASAALMYCTQDDRVLGLTLANPWVRTVAGEARSYLQHYYLQRLLQLSFWRKVLSGKFRPGKSLQELSQTVQRAGAGPDADRRGVPFIELMRTGLAKFSRPILLLLSERDLTAKEFSDLCQRDAGWRRAVRRRNIEMVDLHGADHTFSANESLRLVNAHTARWLDSVLLQTEAA